MNRFISMAAVVLLCSTGSFAQYTNVLDGGVNQTVDTAWTNGAVWVGQTTLTNTLNVAAGGAVVSTNVYVGAAAGANSNAVSVSGGSLQVVNTLTLGPGISNVVTVGSGGALSVSNVILNAGNALNLGSNGTFTVSSGFNASMDGFNWDGDSHLVVGGALTGMAASNNAVYLRDGRDLSINGGSWDISGTNLVVGFGGDGSGLHLRNTGTLSSATTYIGWDTNSANNAVTVNSGSIWINSGNLRVGYGSGGNSLDVLTGGTNTVAGNAFIGGVAAAGNHVLVDGTNSFWSVGGNLAIGGVSNSANNYLEVSGAAAALVDGSLTLNSGNSLILASGGSVLVNGGMNISSNTAVSGTGSILFGTNDMVLALIGDGIRLSTGIVFSANAAADTKVSVSGGSFEVAGSTANQYVNFDTLDLQNSTLSGYGKIDAFGALSMTGGVIDPMGDSTGTLEISGDFSANGTRYEAQVFKTSSDQLIFSGSNPVDLTGLSVYVFVPYAPTGGVATILSGTNLVNSFSTTNIDERLLLYTADLIVTNNQVQVVVSPDNQTLSSALDQAATESVRAGFRGMKDMVFTRTKQLRRNLVATSHAVPNEVYLLTSTNAPAGAMGPGDQNKIFDGHVWLQHFNGQGEFSGAGATDAFSLNNSGTSIGADTLIGEALTVGFNYTYVRSAARADGGDQLDNETYWLGLYGEWVGVDGLYVDALAAYGYSSYDTVRRAINYRGTAAFNGQALAACADVGQYYSGDHLALSPYMGLHALSLSVDGHQEKEDTGSVVNVSQLDRSWIEAAIGLKLRHRFDTGIGRFQTTGYAEWTYDFKKEDVYSTMSSDGLAAAETAHVSPDDTGINAGIGYSWICTDYMEVGIGYNVRLSDSYEEHTGSLMLDIMF